LESKAGAERVVLSGKRPPAADPDESYNV